MAFDSGASDAPNALDDVADDDYRDAVAFHADDSYARVANVMEAVHAINADAAANLDDAYAVVHSCAFPSRAPCANSSCHCAYYSAPMTLKPLVYHRRDSMQQSYRQMYLWEVVARDLEWLAFV